MRFPCLVYRIGGPFQKPGGHSYRYTQATEKTYDGLIEAGWFSSYDEAVDAIPTPKPQLDHDGNGHPGGSLPAPRRKLHLKKETPE